MGIPHYYLCHYYYCTQPFTLHVDASRTYDINRVPYFTKVLRCSGREDVIIGLNFSHFSYISVYKKCVWKEKTSFEQDMFQPIHWDYVTSSLFVEIVTKSQSTQNFISNLLVLSFTLRKF